MATVPPIVVKTEISPAVHRERQALLQRILWSHQFERSPRLRRFLEFVAHRAIVDPNSGVHEQEIGHQVFGRPPGYDTASDNIVRVTASQVRKKLEEYFTTEGASEPVVLEIPRGQYTPTFRERTPEPPAVPVGVTLSAPKAPSRREIVILRSVLAAALCLLIACAALLLHQRRNSETQAEAPAVAALWSTLFSPSRPTSVVVSDSSFSLYQDILGRQLSLADYLAAHGSGEDPSLASNPELSRFARLTFGRALTSRASISTVYRIADLKTPRPLGMLIVRPNEFNMDSMKFANVVLLGSPRANPWVELIEQQLEFRYVYDDVTHHSAFRSKGNDAGNSRNFPTDSKTSYCRIAYLPNLSGNGNIMNIAGTETEGTEGGGEYVTSERTLEQLRQRLGVKDGPFPYFEALLRSDRVGGATPQLSIVATRLIHPSN
jgi:hypothetical protein